MTTALKSRDLTAELCGIAVAALASLTLLVVPLVAQLAALFLVAIAVATIWRPSVGLAALVLTIPVQASLTLAIGGRSLTFTKLALAGLVAGWLVHLVVIGRSPRLTAIFFTLSFYLCVLLASIWNAVDRAAWAGETYRWFTAMLVYLIAANELRSRRDVGVVVTATGLAIAASFVAAAAQVVTHAGPPSFTVNGVTRAFGAFGEPNPFAAYFEIAGLPLLALTATLALGEGSRLPFQRAALVGVPSSLALVGIYLTHSRGGAIGAAVGLAAVVLLVDHRTRNIALAVAGAFALILLASGRVEWIVDRVDALGHGWNGLVQVTSANFSVEERIAHWGAAFRMWMAHPVIGVGAGNFDENFRLFTPIWRFRIPRGHAHDGYLQAVAQAGTVGLVAYCSILAAALQRAVNGVRRAASSVERGVAIGAIAVTQAVIAHGIFDYLHVLNLGLQLSMAWAMLESIPSLDGSGARERTHV